MTRVLRVCPKCGTEIPADAQDGGCPGCLLESGLGLLPNASVAAGDDGGSAEDLQTNDANTALHSKKAERLVELL